LACEELENGQITTHRGIKYNVVRAHLGNIYRKVVVKGKAELILQFLEAAKKARKEAVFRSNEGG